MGTVEAAPRSVHLETIEPIPLPGGSWSRMLLTGGTVPGTTSALGYSVFRPGSETAMVSHQVEELAYVVEGSGELKLDGAPLPFRAGDALHIPPGIWHAVANTGDQNVIMVFTFPHPAYPPTERR